MTTDTPRPRHFLEDVAPDPVQRPEADPENPGEPTPGSDNDRPEDGYTAPDELPARGSNPERPH